MALLGSSPALFRAPALTHTACLRSVHAAGLLSRAVDAGLPSLRLESDFEGRSSSFEDLKRQTVERETGLGRMHSDLAAANGLPSSPIAPRRYCFIPLSSPLDCMATTCCNEACLCYTCCSEQEQSQHPCTYIWQLRSREATHAAGHSQDPQ